MALTSARFATWTRSSKLSRRSPRPKTELEPAIDDLPCDPSALACPCPVVSKALLRVGPLVVQTIERPKAPSIGDYFVARERDLFRVVEAAAGRVLLEDCRTETLIDVGAAEVARLRRVEPDARMAQ